MSNSGEVSDKIREMFNKDFTKKFFKVDVINKLLDDHINGKKDNYRKVWTIYSFLTWYEIFFLNE